MHFLDEEGFIACNPRDREAAHRADFENMASPNAQAVTCKKCLKCMKRMRGGGKGRAEI